MVMKTLTLPNLLSFLLKTADILDTAATDATADIRQSFEESRIDIIKIVERLDTVYRDGYDFSVNANKDGVAGVGPLRPSMNLTEADIEMIKNVGLF
jgi:hypothetical protein